jgi:hypothetical protein
MPLFTLTGRTTRTYSKVIEAASFEAAAAVAASWQYSDDELDEEQRDGNVELEQHEDFDDNDDGADQPIPFVPLWPERTTNKEIVTFTEWATAAGIWAADSELEPLPIGSAYEAWLAGEDPTEWRAEAQRGERIG